MTAVGECNGDRPGAGIDGGPHDIFSDREALAGPANGLDEEPDAARAHAGSSAQDASDGAVTGGPCPGDMVEIKGSYCPELDQRCRVEIAGRLREFVGDLAREPRNRDGVARSLSEIARVNTP